MANPTTFEMLEEIDALNIDGITEIDIFVEPPEETGNATDCDTDDEECINPFRLSGSQLSSGVEIVLDRARLYLEESDEDDEDDGKEKTESIETQIKRVWSKDDVMQFVYDTESPLPRCVLSLAAKTHPVEFFKLFMSEDIVKSIVYHTNKYATRCNNPNMNVTCDEMYSFIGVLIVSGYVRTPRRHMFWSGDCQNGLITQAMSGKRFEEIFKYLHLVDNDDLQPGGDKTAKILPILEKLNEKFLRYAPMEKNITVDEMMIPYFARNGCKQFLRRKYIRFGFKAWVVATKEGYCLSADLYQGDNDKHLDAIRKSYSMADQEIPLNECAILRMTERIKQHYPENEFSIFCDNFFTSPRLADMVAECGWKLTGAVGKNRMENCPLIAEQAMKKTDRGAYDHRVDKKSNVCVVRWNDRKIVTLLSNEHGIQPLGMTKRFLLKSKETVDIPQPNVVSMYNQYKGGVNQLDCNIEDFRISIRGRKWYIPILFWAIDLAVNNAYLLAKSMGYDKSNLKFRREISISIIRLFNNELRWTNHLSTIPLPLSQHVIITGQMKKRCRMCEKKTNKACKACKVALHDECFVEYHK